MWVQFSQDTVCARLNLISTEIVIVDFSEYNKLPGENLCVFPLTVSTHDHLDGTSSSHYAQSTTRPALLLHQTH